MATPEGWTTAALASVSEFIGRGQAPAYADTETDVFAVSQKCVRNGRVTPDAARPHDPSKPVKPSALLRAGDVCVNSTGTGTAGRVGLWSEDLASKYFVDTHVTIVRLEELRAHPKFVAEWLLSADTQKHMEDECFSGSTNQIELSRAAFAALEVPLPPLGEQRKIAAILSSIDDTIEKTEAVIAQLEVVKKAMMQELLTRGMPGRHTRFKHTEIGEIPEGWSVRRVSDVALRVTDGTHQTPTFTDSGVPFLLVRSISRGFVDWTACKYVDASTYEALTKRCRPERGDVLYTAVGATYGVAVVVDRDDPFTFQRHVALIKPKNGLVDADFLALAINSPAGRRQSDVAAVGNAQPTVTLGSLSAFVVPTPSLDEQKDIARVCHSFDRRLVQEAECLRSLRLCKVALASALLSGDLRVTPAEAAP